MISSRITSSKKVSRLVRQILSLFDYLELTCLATAGRLDRKAVLRIIHGARKILEKEPNIVEVKPPVVGTTGR
jgi:hypothetical protein